jgi:hypothetical protein
LDNNKREDSIENKDGGLVHKHDTVRELRLVVEAVDVAAILGNGDERDKIAETESRSGSTSLG